MGPLDGPPDAMVRVSVIQVRWTPDFASESMTDVCSERGQFEDAQRKVGCHQGSGLAQQHFVKGAAESADAGERSDADSDRENHEQKFEG